MKNVREIVKKSTAKYLHSQVLKATAAELKKLAYWGSLPPLHEWRRIRLLAFVIQKEIRTKIEKYSQRNL
jgi:hypothetical protein